MTTNNSINVKAFDMRMIFAFLSQREVVYIGSVFSCGHYNTNSRINGSLRTFTGNKRHIFLDQKEAFLVYIECSMVGVYGIRVFFSN